MATKKEVKFVNPGSENTGSVKFVRASQIENPGVVAEGIYVGTLPNKFVPEKNDFKIESLEADKDGNKEITIVNQAGNLGYKMSLVKVGDLIQIKYNGKIKAEKGKAAGKMVHNFEVLRGE
jgi:hypothetical protein